MIKKISLLSLITMAVFAVSLLYPSAYADSVYSYDVTVFGDKQVTMGDLPVIYSSGIALIQNEEDIKPAISMAAPQQSNNITTAAPDTSVNREMRGTWIATVKNINMPEGMNEAAFRKWAVENMNFLVQNNFNTAVFQVRPTGDALYKSVYAPWSSFITGKAQGTDPGYDPLQIMIDEAHARGIELHAWINPYRLTMPSDKVSGFAANNIAKLNPSWMVSYGGQYYLNPGIAGVREHLINVVSEIVDNYDVDAIHIDDYFYPYPVSGGVYNDDKEFAAYGQNFANKDDWRRDNVTKLVKEIYDTIKAKKSHVQFGISPFGVWRNKTNDPTGSDTNAGHETYSSLYADTRLWIKEGIIDYITPQVYWSTEFAVANYKTLIQWWNNEIKTEAVKKPVNLYIGMADYKVNDNADVRWNNPNEINLQVSLNRNAENISGQMHYSIASLKTNALNHVNMLKSAHYNNVALTPAVAILNPQGCAALTGLTAAKVNEGIKLNILSNDANTRKLLIYRFEGNSVGEFNSASLIGVTYNTNGNTSYTDTTAAAGKTYTYAVKPVSAHGVVNQAYKSAAATN